MLSAICTACGRTKQRKTLCYDTQFRGYCLNICHAEHPNSPTSLKKRGHFADLMSYQDASETVANRANALYKSGARTANKRPRNVEATQILQDTISFRIRDDAHSDYIMYVMGREGFNKVSQAIHTIINTAILADQTFLSQAAGMSNLQHVPVMEQIEEKLQAEKPIPEQEPEEVFEV